MRDAFLLLGPWLIGTASSSAKRSSTQAPIRRTVLLRLLRCILRSKYTYVTFMPRVIGGASWRLLPNIRETNGRKNRKDSFPTYARNFDSYVIFLLRPLILYDSMYYGVRYFNIDLIFINPILFRNIYLLRIVFRTKSIVFHELIGVFIPRFDLFALVFVVPISDIINRAFNITGVGF